MEIECLNFIEKSKQEKKWERWVALAGNWSIGRQDAESVVCQQRIARNSLNQEGGHGRLGGYFQRSNCRQLQEFCDAPRGVPHQQPGPRVDPSATHLVAACEHWVAKILAQFRMCARGWETSLWLCNCWRGWSPAEGGERCLNIPLLASIVLSKNVSSGRWQRIKTKNR